MTIIRKLDYFNGNVNHVVNNFFLFGISEDENIVLIHTNNLIGTYTVGNIAIDGNWDVRKRNNDIILQFLSGVSWYGQNPAGHTENSDEAVANGGKLNIIGTEDGLGSVKRFYGSYSENSNASNGEVAIIDGTFNNVVVAGGMVTSDSYSASNNKVNIYNGNFTGTDIYGGASKVSGAIKNSGTENTVNVYNGTFNDSNLYDVENINGGTFNNGGITGDNLTVNAGTFDNVNVFAKTGGNSKTFNVNTKLSGFNEVKDFQIMNFTLPRDTTNGSQILSTKTVSLDNTKINVAAMAGVSLSDNDTITLIHTTNGITGTFTVGDITLNGNWEIKQDGNDIILVASDEDNPPDDPNPPAPPTPINVDDGYDGSQIIHNLATGSAAEKWCNNIAANQPNADMRQNTINTMTNMEQLANVQHGNYSLTNLAMDETFNHMSVRNRNLEYSSMPKYKLRNTAARRGNYRIDQIDVGRVDDVLPTHQLDRIIDGDSRRTSPRTSRYNGYSRNNYNDNYYNNGRNSDRDYYAQRRSYKNYEYISSGGEEEQMVWATYIHSKEEIKDMEVGHLKQDSTLKYNGATVGADLWQSDHGFGGLALTYAKGDVNSVQKVSSVKNDVDYYGGSIYHRTDSGKFSVQLDATYSNSKNDIKMQTLGAEDIKIKPKTEAYSAGIKIEEPIEINEKTNIVPFIGVRYTHMRTEKTQSNIDIAYGSNEQDMCSVPLGVSLRNQFEVSDSMKLGTVLDAGYIFNIGDRKGKQRLIYGAVTDTVNYNIVDKGQYFIKAAIQAICENMMWELGYHYSKSSKVKDDKWYVNADFKF